MAKCNFPEYFQSDDRCCVCGELIRLCPCSFDDAMRHGKQCHGISEPELSQARFVARLEDPYMLIHAEVDVDY